MPITVTHTTVATGGDAGNGVIRKAQWNEAHSISGTVDIANGGTGAATAAQALTNLAAAGITISNTFTNSRNTFGDGTADTRITINGAASTTRGLRLQTAGSSRWAVTVDSTSESGSNVGSDFSIDRYNDAGTYIDTPFEIKRDTGMADITIRSGNKVGNGSGGVYYGINGAAASDRIIEFESSGSNRWGIGAEASAESGSNAGSDFRIYRYDDTGGFINSVFEIQRSSGLVYVPTFDSGCSFGNGTAAVNVYINGVAGTGRAVWWRTNNSNRWELSASNTAESGSNAGSNFLLSRYNDAGSYVDTPISVNRANGNVSVNRLSILDYIVSGSNVGTNDGTYSSLDINRSAGVSGAVRYQTAGSTRWEVGVSSSAESGSNAGSNFMINRYDDTGTFVDTPFSIVRSTGNITLTGSIDFVSTDTTLSRLAAGTLGVEGKTIPYVFAQSAVATSVGAVTTETTLATVTIPGGAMGPNGWIEIWFSVTVTNNANNKTHRVRLGGIAGTAIADATLTTSNGNTRRIVIANRNSASSQIGLAPTGNNTGAPGSYGAAYATASVNTASNWDLVFTGQKANSADTFTLEAYQVIIQYGA